MPRPKTNLDTWRTAIEQRISEGKTQTEIRNWLQGNGIMVSRGTFRSILRLWNAQSDRSRLRKQGQDASVPTAVHELWSQQHLDDVQIAETLTTRGIALSAR